MKERVYGGRLNLQCVHFPLKLRVVDTKINVDVGRYEEHLAQQESGAVLPKSSIYVSGRLLYKVCIFKTDGLLYTCS